MIDDPPPLGLWAQAFLLTCVVELPIYFLLLRRRLGTVRPWLLALAVNLTTHPALWYLTPRFEPYELWVVVVESGVVIVEGLLIALALWRVGLWSTKAPDPAAPTTAPPPHALRALGLGLGAAFTANVISTAMGFLVQALGWGSGE